MALTLPPEASALYAPQSAPDNIDFASIVAGIGWNGVVSGCGVTAQGSPNMTVAVASGTVAIGGVEVAVSAVSALTIGAAGAADRRDIVVVNNAGTVSVVAGTTAGAVNGTTPIGSRDPGKGAIPANSVVLAEVYVAANTTSIASGNIYDKSTTVPTTAPAGLTIPAGQSLTTGTRGVFGDSRSVTTNASDTVDLGTFSTTGGALELRIHAYLAAPAAGTTASVTKVYELAASALMGTVSTWYLCLPADASANAAATNDFALEVQRTAAGTFQFRFRQKSIGLAGAITFVVENLGDTTVTFTKSTTVTAAPTAVTVAHPSNSLTLAAGNVGIGVEAPAALLDVASVFRVTASDVTTNYGVIQSVPRGTVTSSSGNTTTTGVTTTGTLVPGTQAASFTAISGRRYKITIVVIYADTVATDQIGFSLRDGGASSPTNASTVVRNWAVTPGSTSVVSTAITFDWSPSAGSHTLGVFGSRGAGTGTISLGNTTAGYLSSILVEDIGT